MKHFNLHIYSLLIFLLSGILLPLGLYAQLHGNYTINPINSASSSNYRNWASAVGDLLSGSRTDGGTAQGPGVNAAVVFTVYDTVYNAQVSITAISGASSTNTITFQGTSDSSKCLLRYASGTSATDDWVLKLDGAKWITFKKIGFQRTGTSAYYTVIQLLNDANRNTITNCWFKTCKVPSTSAAGWTTGVGAQVCFTGHADSVIINQNRMIYGYNSIYSGNSTTCYGTTITKNVFDTLGSIGVYMTYQTGMKISGNTFNMGDFGTGTGHYVSYAVRIETSPAVVITNNKMYMKAINGQVLRAMVFVSVNASSTDPSIITNNFIVNYGGSSSTSCISMYSVQYMEICNNNFLVTSSLSAASIIHENPTYTNAYVKLINNNLINKGNGMIYDMTSTTHTGFDTLNYNNYYCTGSTFGLWTTSGTYTSFSGWKSGTSYDAASKYIDPGYVNNLDLHVSNIGINGKATPYWRVTTDIDGDTRDATYPDIGADEFFPTANDAGISSLDSPSVFCAGSKNVKITFQNYGADTLKSLNIYWKINGTSQTTYNWSGAIPPGSSSTTVTLGNYSFSQNVAYNFKIWGVNPNGMTDGNHANDTLSVTRYTGMSGTYTIGSTGDFQSVNNALTAVTSRGICGAITFNIANGTYQEQLTFPQIANMNANNTITFQSASADSTKVIITHPSTSATGTNNACIQLNGGDFITFKKLTIQRTGTNAQAYVIHILNGSNNNSFLNCRIIGTNYTATTSINIWSDQSRDNDNVFKNNYINQGYYNMQYLGTSSTYEGGTIIEGNVFDSAYNSAVQIGYNNNAQIKGNIFKNIRTYAASSYDLQLLDCDNQINVSANSFYNATTDASILLTNCNGTAASPGLIYNNVIVKTSGTGISLDAVDYQNVVFNNIKSSGTAGISTSANSSSNILMKNNNIFMTAGYVIKITTAGQVSASNRNNFYNTSANTYANWDGKDYNNLSSLIAGSKKDSASISVDPLFYSSTNLHVKNAALKGAGEPISGVTTDMDGETRNATHPDIGADEFDRMNNDAGIIAISRPSSTDCEGILTVAAVIKNFGKDTLKSAQISWAVDKVNQIPKNWYGNLATNNTDTIVLGTFNFRFKPSPAILAGTSSPNGKADDIPLNDTLTAYKKLSALPITNAGADANVCQGDSIQIGTKATAGHSYIWHNTANTVIGNTAQIYVKPSAASTYILQETITSTGCSNTDSVKIGVNSKPAVNAGNDTLICQGSSVQIGSGFQTGFSYSWTSIPPGFTTIVASPTVTPSKTTSYVLRKSQNSTGCYAIDTVTITVAAKPKPKVTGDTIVCEGNQSTFSTTFNSGNSYFWKVNLGQIISGQGTESVLIDWPAIGKGSVKVIETTSSNCTDSSAVNVNVILKPDIKMVIYGRCSGRKVSFYDSSMYSVTRYWDFGDSVNSSLQNPEHIYQDSGSYVVKLIVYGPQGCSDSAFQTISVSIPPKADFDIDSSICFGELIKIFNNSTNAISYFWDFNNGQTSTFKNPPDYTYSSPGSYSVKLITNGVGCTDEMTKNVTVNAMPTANFGYDSHPNIHYPTQFSDSSTISSGSIISWNWQFGDGDSSILQNPTHLYATDSSFDVELCVTSSGGCSNCIIKKINVANGINSSMINKSIFLFPNPNDGIFIIKTDQRYDLIEITDIMGKVVMVLKPQSNIISIDLSLQPKGIYFVKVKSGEDYIEIKIIKH